MLRPREIRCKAGQTLWPLGKHLIDMPVSLLHGGEHGSDEVFRHVGMEQVGHGVDEDPAGFFHSLGV